MEHQEYLLLRTIMEDGLPLPLEKRIVINHFTCKP